MKLFCLVALCLAPYPLFAQTTQPLRIFLRAGPKTHGPGQHDGPRWLAEWKPLLSSRGAKVDGAIGFPTAEQLENTDVLVMYSAEGGAIKPAQREYLDKFLKRGGGIVAIHDSVCGDDAQWFKTIIGGAWEHGHSKWFEGDVSIYFTDRSHPITKDVSNFDFDDEIYWDLHMMPEAHVLAATYAPDRRNTKGGRIYPSVYDIVPQMWTYEKELAGATAPYRAFVSIPGHMHKSFSLPHFRAVLLRGIAWAGKRDADSLCDAAELASLRYPEGGPTAPEKAAEKIVVPPEFNLRLVASEPLINKAISLDWDPAGRMWVAETPEYPNGRRVNPNDKVIAAWKDRDPATFVQGKEQRPARDRISILEDPDPQGRYRKKSVFYEGLELVTSLVFYRDGVIVSQAPDILWLRDTDGDGKADKVEKLYTGFGTGDTHAVISNLRWGMDGWVYATVGYSKGDIYSGDEKTHFGRISEGVIRFKPNGKALEQISSKGGNCWGVDFDWDNEIFWTQATSGDHLMHVVLPETALARGKVGSTTSYHVTEDHKKSYPLMSWTKQAYVQIDLVGSYTAVAGCCIYSGGAWPEKWNGSQFCSEPTINIVHHDFLKPTGTTYLASREKEEEFIGSRDLWFRPIHTRVGPDGALYIIDLYNQAVVHNDTRGTPHGANNAAVRPDRDHYFARIWRVQHNEAKKLDIPNLNTTPAELVKALEHPNMWVRMTAQRLLCERGWVRENPAVSLEAQIGTEPLRALARNESVPPYARVHALWTRCQLAANVDARELGWPAPPLYHVIPDLQRAFKDSSPAVRKAAFQIVMEDGRQVRGATPLTKGALTALKDSDARVRLSAIQALGAMTTATAGADVNQISEALVSIYPDLHDPWLESAVIGVATESPLEFIRAALASSDPGALQTLVRQLSSQIASKADPAAASALVMTLTAAPANADALKQIILEDLAKGLKSDTVPAWTPELQKSFQTLLTSPNPGLGAAALPLIARWDKNGVMADLLKSLVQQLSAKLNDSALPDEQRAQVAASLLAVRTMNPDMLPAIGKILGSASTPTLQRKIIEALGANLDSSIEALLVDAYGKLNPSLQETVFTQLIKRSDSSLALVEALKSGKIDLATLGPIAMGRLRTHSDKAVAMRANAVLDELRGPEVKEKNALIAQFAAEVEKPGNIENGHKLFTQNCSVCHSFKGEGKDVAPDLTGMGAKGAEELLVHVLDPNRYVEPNFFSFSIETKDGETYDGIIGRENRSSVVLRNASGDVELKTENIKSRRNTGLSLMPNGFESLGGEGFRDLLGYICADENRYRMLDLKDAFTASSTRGIYVSTDLLEDTLRFKKFGIVRGGNVPFEIITPNRTAAGNNLIVLKGGEGVAKSMPQKVEIDHVGVMASRLHFLGGVGGWAWPFGDKSRQNMPVVKVTVSFADAQSEEIILRNGVEFVDWIDANNDVPGSKQIPDLLRRGQVRWFTKTLQHRALIQKITLESFDNAVAPTFVAITAEVGEGAESAATQHGTRNTDPKTEPVALNLEPAPSPMQWGPGVKTLIFGGGSSHDFGRWFNQADTALLRMGGKASVNYTDKPPAVLPALKDIDVLYLSSNQPLPDSSLHKAIFDFADAGKGLLLVHPGLWYNWKNWPEYNRQLVGGGASSHDKFGEFEVTVGETSHMIMTGVPATFKISDELYHFQRDEQGPPIQVLATGKSPITGKTFPVVWLVKHPKARIACVTLGHDGKAHEHPAFQAILQNSAAWAAGK